ncbi:MAG: DNA (cytosine-5-)-methyltransferase [Thermodesulfobacteriota bacterium]
MARAKKAGGDLRVFRLGELFSGPGGLALGASQATFSHKGVTYRVEHQWAIDYHEDSCRTYRRNICPGNPDSVICNDVRKLDFEHLQPIDALAFGFPCNDFSIVGEQKGLHGEFGPLYSYGVKILNLMHPLFFVAENVGGILSADDGMAFKKILSDLIAAGDGYNLAVNLYKAEQYGVPQTRHRMIIVGMKRSLGLTYQVPAPTTCTNPVTARMAIECPPIPDGTPNHEIRFPRGAVLERLKRIRPGENAWTADLPDELRLNVKAATLSQIYKRLDPDKPSYTITGSGGGGTHGYHWSEPRALTNRERARIQTFPDSFVFEGSRESVRRQIGMAVPPLLSQVVFRAILMTIAGMKYDQTSSSYKPVNSLFEQEGVGQNG